MASLELQRTDRGFVPLPPVRTGDSGSGGRTPGRCTGCRGCAARDQAIRLRGISADRIRLELDMTSQARLLLHSWILPLLLLVASCLLSRSLALDETIAVGIALTALVTGILLCRRVPETVLKTTEIC